MFITFEGTEGSGKSTVLEAVAKKLREEGYDIVETREPGGTPISEAIRNVILAKENVMMDARTEALLYAASRRQHLIEKVWPMVKAGRIVISDRFLDSSLAYQGGARGLGVKAIHDVNLYATEGCEPDLTVFFDIDPALGLQRISSNKGREVNRLDLEKLAFHQKVHATFKAIIRENPARFAVIDASRPLKDVIEEVMKVIKERLTEKSACH